MARTTKEPRQARPTARGWSGPGGGMVGYVDPAPEWRGTSVQVCGLWPFGAGAGTPMVGVPLGRDLDSGATVCCDPVSWFTRTGLLANPSMFVLGRPGLGKSTVVRRMALGLAGYGVHPLIFGDLKPDYVDLIRTIGGQVISLGRGRGNLNVLDPGESIQAATRLTGEARGRLLADIHGRRLHMVSALVTILRSAPPTDREETILSAALNVLDDRHGPDRVPVLGDLVQVIKDAPEAVRSVALDRGDITRYRDITENLEASLTALLGDGRLGGTFARPTTEAMQLDRPVCFDISGIDDSEVLLQAAALLSCWSYGFGAVSAAHALADAGLEPQRNYFLVMDELWRVLQAGRGLVDRVNALTRLDRQRGVGHAMITHTLDDLLALPNEEDRTKAKGFVERAGMVICAGLPPAEMPQLSQVVELTEPEQRLLVDWSTPPAWDAAQGRRADPPGLGNFLIKVGSRPGIPLHVDLTAAELEVNNTNKRWNK
ncbi:ATP/GTP-binding protein [Streptomyces ureilyticus]|uniref:ATP/GTP-binding protein n=1 Tax=Streptomyces ureilyticus TaxID=1775131 RepID=A0ABX0E1K3_9ACTN|nr:ATP/GTP-binding protein [Streptomyces ureilyticus]NGO47325.1 ATP/GTP-binding protein [Streptomyces ureilyticus]